MKIATTLGTFGKTESVRIALTSGLNTEEIASRIKKLSKLRDETLQVMRQVSLTREAGPSPADKLDYNSELESAKQELEDARNQYQEVQAKVERIQKQIEDSKKKMTALIEISETGFAAKQLESGEGEFRRTLGRLPAKKLEAAKKAMQSQFKDQVILAIGDKKQDAVFVLVATPRDKLSQAVQTLLLYDFTPIEIPEYESLDVRSEIQREEAKVKEFSKDLDKVKLQLDDLRKKAGQTLNKKLDDIINALMLLRGILKLGEGTQVSRIYARLERVIPADVVNTLTRKGIVELEPS